MNCDEVILQLINSLDIPFRKDISSTLTKWYPGAQAPPGVSADRRIIVYGDSNLPKLNIPTHYLFHKISQKYFTPTKNTSAVFVSLRRLCKPYDRKNYNDCFAAQNLPSVRLFHEFVTVCRVYRQTDSRANAREWMNEPLSIDWTENRQQP